jgi:hypothetical protein
LLFVENGELKKLKQNYFLTTIGKKYFFLLT